MNEEASINTEDGSAVHIGREIDKLLDMDDGTLLAEMARLRSNLVALFGRDEIVALIRKTVDEAENVEFFTHRSRRDIDKYRPVVSLHVIPSDRIREVYGDTLGVGMLDKDWNELPFGSGVQIDDPQQIKYYSLLSGIIHKEICTVIAEEMRLALQKHWEKAKIKMSSEKEGIASMIIFQIFAIMIDPDLAQARQRGRRRCTLRLMI